MASGLPQVPPRLLDEPLVAHAEPEHEPVREHRGQQLGRPVVKAWNAIGSGSFATNGSPAGSPGRIALPVAADDERHRKTGMQLVEDTGFDAVDAGTLAESWR